jgi:hypothetical protein
LQQELDARELTANALALKLRVPANRLTEILNGKRGISAETALPLSRSLGPSGETLWRNGAGGGRCGGVRAGRFQPGPISRAPRDEAAP